MKKELNCGSFLESLSDYIDETAGDAICAEIEKHMSDCEDCRVVVDTLKKTIYLYHETSTEEKIPSGVRERLFLRLALDDFIVAEKSFPENATF